jgi:hypothetical protein
MEWVTGRPYDHGRPAVRMVGFLARVLLRRAHGQFIRDVDSRPGRRRPKEWP